MARKTIETNPLMVGDKPSAASLVRLALAAGVTKPAEIQAWIMENHQIEVSTGSINQTKQSEKKKTGGVKKAPAQKAAAMVHGISLADIDHARDLIAKLGGDGAKQLIDKLR